MCPQHVLANASPGRVRAILATTSPGLLGSNGCDPTFDSRALLAGYLSPGLKMCLETRLRDPSRFSRASRSRIQSSPSRAQRRFSLQRLSQFPRTLSTFSAYPPIRQAATSSDATGRNRLGACGSSLME
jgi:hypothetical protein